MIEGEPDLAAEQRLLHEIIIGRVRIDRLPECLEGGPHGLGLGRAERGHHATGIGRIEIAFEEPGHQALRPRGKPEPALTGLLLDRFRPGRELVVAERVDVGAGRQIGQRLLVGDHDVGCLHPGDIELLVGAELAELHEARGNAAIAELRRDVVDGVEGVDGSERLQLAVAGAHHAHRALAGLRLRFHADRQRCGILGHERDLLRKALEDDVAQLLRLLERPELSRHEDDVVGARMAAR